jgi:hypothetical protein
MRLWRATRRPRRGPAGSDTTAASISALEDAEQQDAGERHRDAELEAAHAPQLPHAATSINP